MKQLLDQDQIKELLETLKNRFEAHMKRHPNWSWNEVEKRLLANPDKLGVLQIMEDTGGEPDVVEMESGTDNLYFVDCSKETPAGRRNCCYDDEALASRKQYKPERSAVGMAKEMGIDLLSEEEYRRLQTFGEFDLATSSWVATPPAIRKLKGALFCDRRYNTVFLYHNGAESYYGVRGFRGWIKF